MTSRLEAEVLLEALASGDFPLTGVSIVRTDRGWIFRGAMALLDQDGDQVDGQYLDTIPLFDVDVISENPRLKLKSIFDGGNKGSNFSVDAANGGAQKFVLTASVTLVNITNLVGVEPMNVYVDLSGGAYTLTLDSANFDGPQLIFSGATGLAISFVDFSLAGGKITAMGQDW